MKIMHIAGGGDTGGAKTHIITLLSELSKNHEVCLISLRGGSFAQAAEQAGIRTAIVSNRIFFGAVKATVKQVRAFKPDIVHCHGAKANLMGVSTKTTKERIAIMDINIEVENIEELNKVIRNIKKVDSVYEVRR